MICKNCGKEIGTQSECSFCGFSATLDGEGGSSSKRIIVKLSKTKIELLKTPNGIAKSGLVMSILSFIPLPFMLLALIFNIKGACRCKSYRSGLPQNIIAWIFFVFWVLFYALFIYSLYETGSSYGY